MCGAQPTTCERGPTQRGLSEQPRKRTFGYISQWCLGGKIPKTYFDVRVFNPLAPSNRNHAVTCSNIQKTRTGKETGLSAKSPVQKVEHSSFTPLVLSVTGGMGVEASLFYKRLSSLLAQKWDITYNKTLCWLRCRLTFSLLRSAIQAIRGARSSVGHAARTSNQDTH